VVVMGSVAYYIVTARGQLQDNSGDPAIQAIIGAIRPQGHIWTLAKLISNMRPHLSTYVVIMIDKLKKSDSRPGSERPVHTYIGSCIYQSGTS